MLVACGRGGDSHYEQFDRDHKHVTEPIQTFHSNFSGEPRVFDFSYLDKLYPGSTICFESGYVAPLGGIPEAMVDKREIVPGRRSFHNGGATMGVMTGNHIYTFLAQSPSSISVLRCRNLDQPVFTHPHKICFHAAKAIGQEFYDEPLSKALGRKTFSMAVDANCPTWAAPHK
jgi:hypothetical protein